MTSVEALEPTYPNGWVEEELCKELSSQPLPDIPIYTTAHKTSISGAKVWWTHTSAEDESLLVDNRPIIIENGLCGSDEAYVALTRRLAAHGYTVLTKVPPRHQRLDIAYQPHNITHPMELQAKASWAVMREYMRIYPTAFKHEVQKFHLVGHSMGGPVATDLAVHHPEHVDTVTLIASAGLERHNTPKMACRLGEVAIKELAPAFLLPGRITNSKLALASLKHATGVLNRTVREAVQVSNYNTIPSLKRLKSTGIDLYNIQPQNDHFFPYANQLSSVHLFTRFIKFNVGRADHLAPQTQSELVSAVIADLLAEPQYDHLFAA